MNWQDHIERRKGIMLGKPVFKGTRFTVEFLLERLADGAPEDDLLRNYPDLTHERILAALEYAAALIRNDEAVIQL